MVIKNKVIKETNPGTPKQVTVPKVKTLIGITTFKELMHIFKPYNNKNEKITFLTNEINFFIILITFINVYGQTRKIIILKCAYGHQVPYLK